MSQSNDSLIRISKIPDCLKDGRLVVLYRAGVHWGCHFEKGKWRFGDSHAPQATHFTFPPGTVEQAGSGI